MFPLTVIKLVFKLVLMMSLYTLICLSYANAQGKKIEEEPSPILVKHESLRFDDLLQIPESIKVMSVIDGKTFVSYEGKTYQLASLDVELDEGSYARQGKDFLEILIKDKTLILFQTKNSKIGRQNRMGHEIVHAIIETDQTWLQPTLLANGLARVRTSFFNSEQATELLRHEEGARKNLLGLWDGDFYQILSPQNAEDHIGSFHIVEGVIKKVAVTRNNIYLNFGDSWKTDFTIGVPPSVRKKISKKNVSLLNWGGKTVRIRGWISSYNGPYIELTHIEQIELLDKKQEDNLEE